VSPFAERKATIQPSLEQSSEFAAAAAGLDYPALINGIVDHACRRFRK
jgi:hypothetical protein